MKYYFRLFLLALAAAALLTAPAWAAEDTLKVGLYYGSSALPSANLQNYQGSGYRLGWFDEESRDFVEVGWLEEEKITMSADGVSGPAYHVELDRVFDSFLDALLAAEQVKDAFPAYIDGEHRVRAGSFASREEAEIAAATYATYTWEDRRGEVRPFRGEAVSPSATGVNITVTGTSDLLFQFDCSGARALGVQPEGSDTLTWFKGYKWYGGFEYRRSTGGSLNVINVVSVDDYVRGVLPYEMNSAWPLEALKAQAVVARTYALCQSKHYASYRFDVCNTVDCQVYQGANLATANSDRAAAETAGIGVSYQGRWAETVYCSSNGGASESAENVWSEARGYLVGKEDPYEGTISIPGYTYSVHYTFGQLTSLLQSKGYSIGQVSSAYVSQTTPTGNAAAVTFQDKNGKTLTITKEACRLVLGTKSMRFTITGGGGNGGYCINSAETLLPSLEGVYVLSEEGSASAYSVGEAYAATSSGVSPLSPASGPAASGDGITITGTGNGHGVGMSQYGAKAMAELGFGYEEILRFYYTDIDLERIG